MHSNLAPRSIRWAAAALLVTLGSASAQNLTIGIRAGPDSMDPHFTATGTHAEAMKEIFDTLTWSGDKLQVEPGLAESWKQLNDTTWEFKLRRGVKFHDGQDFTAEDVKFSIERIPTLSGPNPTTIYVRRVKETKIVDPYTVQVITDGPAPSLPYDFIRVFIVSHKAAAGLTKDTANEAFNSGKAAIGTGPYKLVKWVPREELVLERNPTYWRGPAAWAQVVRREIPNDAARVAQLKAGQVDMIVRVPAADVPSLEKDPKLTVVKVDSVYVFNIQIDMREKTPQVTAKDGSPLPQNPFRDARVREAIDLAIDRQALAEVAMEGLGKPQSQVVTPNIFGWNKDIPEDKPNLARARQLMQEAGYPNGFKVVFSFTNDRLPGDRAVGTAVAQMLARINLDVQANGQPGATLFPARTRGELSMMMSGWGTLTGEAHYTLSSMAHSNAPNLRMGAFNWNNYKNDKVDKLLQDASIELNDEKRRVLLAEAGALFRADRPVIPLASVSSAWAMQKGKVAMPGPRTDEDTLSYFLRPPPTN